MANVILFIILLTLICIYRQDWLHKIDQERIDREIARADRQYKQDVKRFGAKFMQEQDKRELKQLERELKMQSDTQKMEKEAWEAEMPQLQM